MTLSAIAREFECTPSAISYIVRKAEASGGKDEGDVPFLEPSLPLDPPPVSKAETMRKDAAPARADAVKPENTPPDTAKAEPADTPAAAQPAPAVEASPAPAPHSPHGETLKLSRPESGPPVSQAASAPPPAPTADAPAAAKGPAGSRPAEQQTPVDTVEARLRETAKACLGAYRTWRQQPGEGSIQSLSDAVHELRKALARIEIDMSASRKEEQAIRPIPIPAHRAARRHQ